MKINCSFTQPLVVTTETLNSLIIKPTWCTPSVQYRLSCHSRRSQSTPPKSRCVWTNPPLCRSYGPCLRRIMPTYINNTSASVSVSRITIIVISWSCKGAPGLTLTADPIMSSVSEEVDVGRAVPLLHLPRLRPSLPALPTIPGGRTHSRAGDFGDLS